MIRICNRQPVVVIRNEMHNRSLNEASKAQANERRRAREKGEKRERGRKRKIIDGQNERKYRKVWNAHEQH